MHIQRFGNNENHSSITKKIERKKEERIVVCVELFLAVACWCVRGKWAFTIISLSTLDKNQRIHSLYYEKKY